MESHESAGIPEEEYARLRRRTILNRGCFFGLLCPLLFLGDEYEKYGMGGRFWAKAIYALFFGLSAGWFVGKNIWENNKERIIETYKRQRGHGPARKPIRAWVAWQYLVYCGVGLAALGLDFRYSSRALKDYAVAAAIIGGIITFTAMLRLMRREAYYRQLTTPPELRLSIEQYLLEWGWMYAALLATFPLGSEPVFGLSLFFSILFFPLDLALAMRSRREFGDGERSAAEA